MSKNTKAARRARHERNNGAYFNRENMYISGLFSSKKSRGKLRYRSSYEKYFMMLLEEDDNVLSFVSEPLGIRYVDAEKNQRTYIPDILILYADGSTELVEIKPKRMLKANNVRRKAAAAQRFLMKFHPETRFRFVTEDDIFDNLEDYKSKVKESR